MVPCFAASLTSLPLSSQPLPLVHFVSLWNALGYPVVQFDNKAKSTQWRVPQVGWSHNAHLQIKSFINLVAKELKIVRVY